jgi:hypothetical protein
MLMPEDELNQLADSIQRNGLRHAIVVDQYGRIVDGRNRLRACDSVGIQPDYVSMEFADDDEVAAFIMDQNNHRRHISKGQRAMAVAFMYPGEGKGHSDNVKSKLDSSLTFARVKQARQVFRHSAELALEVKDGLKTLDAALIEVQKQQRERQSDESKLDEVRQYAPDLADLVAEERMTVEEAFAACQQRRHQRNQTYEAGLIAAKRLRNYVLDVEQIAMARTLERDGSVESTELKDFLRKSTLDTEIADCTAELLENLWPREE